MRVKISNNNYSFGSKGTLQCPDNKGDAGYDLISFSHPKIVGDPYQGYLFKSIQYIEYDTNIAIEPVEDGYGDYEIFSLLYPRSSISQYNLSLCNSVGVIDSGYRDTIKVRFKYNPQPENYTIIDGKYLTIAVDSSRIYAKGDKIAQLIFAKHVHPKIHLVNKLRSSQRNKGGFGSTGK